MTVWSQYLSLQLSGLLSMLCVSQATLVPSFPPDTVRTVNMRMQVNKRLLHSSVFAPTACSLVCAALATAGLSIKPAQGTESCSKKLGFFFYLPLFKLKWFGVLCNRRVTKSRRGSGIGPGSRHGKYCDGNCMCLHCFWQK